MSYEKGVVTAGYILRKNMDRALVSIEKALNSAIKMQNKP